MPTAPTRVSAADRAHDHVRSLILSGHAAPGAMLSEGQVAADLHVSRTPVREAFARLQEQGWLRVYPQRGALVVEPNVQEWTEVLDARRLLEGHGVQHAIAAGTCTELVAELRDILATQHRAANAADLAESVRADVAFHAAIVRASGNSLLGEIATAVHERHARMTATSLKSRPAAIDMILVDHGHIIQAVLDENTEEFVRLLDNHMTRVHLGAAL